jgi:HSP20 family protein
VLTPRSFYGGDPFRELRRLQDEMNRLLQAAPVGAAAGFPPVNVHAGPDGVAVTAEMPGVAREDLEISVHRDTVTLRGERRAAPPTSGGEVKGHHRRERGQGRFVRTLSLPFQVDPERVEATLSDGVLRLSLQRPESDKPRTIAITAG